MTFISADWVDESYTYLCYNSNKLYVANSEKIKIVSVKLTSLENRNEGKNKVFRHVDKDYVSTIALYDKKTKIGDKIHGLALT